MKNSGGIYKITNLITGRFYIGSALNFKNRWNGHKSALSLNKRCNPKLQDAWNKYGKCNFEFSILELVEKESDILKREQYYIDLLKPHYNSSPNATRTKPAPVSDERKKQLSEFMKGNQYAKGKSHPQTEETRARISNTLKGVKHSPESYKSQADKIRGRKRLPDEQRAISLKRRRVINCINDGFIDNKGRRLGETSGNSKLKSENIIDIRRYYNEGYDAVEIGRIFNVHSSTIYSIIKGKTWKSIPL